MNLRYEVHKTDKSALLGNAYTILMFSIRDGEGKTMLTHAQTTEGWFAEKVTAGETDARCDNI